MKGFQFEKAARNQFVGAGYTQPRIGAGAVTLFKQMYPQRVQQCREALWESEGVDLLQLSPAEVLDRCAALDAIFRSPSGELVGVDFSTCPGKEYGKERKMNTFKPFYEKIGLKRWGVVTPHNIHSWI